MKGEATEDVMRPGCRVDRWEMVYYTGWLAGAARFTRHKNR